MKKLLLIAIMLFVVRLQGQVRIDEREAFSTAESFLQENTGLQSPALVLSETIGSRQSGLTNLYVFSVEPQGFVIVSALNAVLAYSITSPMLKSEALPSHIAYWLNLYNEATDQLFEHPMLRKEPMKRNMAVEPLLTSAWGQGCYHNAACPIDNAGPCHHVEAGCVAVAMAQIMYYHKCPLQGHGKKTYSTSHYGSLTANFGETFYQWEEMSDTLHELNPAVAKLILHCGISVKMQYGPNGSGAYSSDVPDALHHHFYYPAASMATRAFFGDDEWLSMIKDDLDRQRPVYYGGKSNLGGHAFVCDGYDGSGMFHFNFGWDGVADGYYIIDAPYGFSLSQSMIHDIYPVESIPIHCDSHGIIYVTPDGTGDGSSWSNSTSELQQALFKSTTDSCAIWVKEGVYTGNPRKDFAFTTLFNCRLYGGFKGDEPYDYDLSQRDFKAHPSILDGSQKQGVIGEIASNDTNIIDGFTIQNGVAKQGSGILLESNARIRNCIFCHNYSRFVGGAVSQQSPTNSKAIVFEDCEFYDNEAKNDGGAVYDFGNTTYIRCTFHDNRVQRCGGGLYCNNYGSSSQYISCSFSNNTAQQGGGIAVYHQLKPSFWSCLINNNTAQTGGGCYFSKNANLYNCTIVKNEGTEAYGGIFSDSLSNIWNCIVWGNTSPDGSPQIGPMQTYSYCAVQDDHNTRGDNYNAASANDGESADFYIRFKNPDIVAGSAGYGGDWRLQPNSLCINRSVHLSGQTEYDLDGNPRRKHNKVDLGAYESNTAVRFIDAYYCEDDPYYYQDSLLPGIGYYSFFYPGDVYDSLDIIHMSNPFATVFYSEEICEHETYDFFGTPITEAGVYYHTINCTTHRLYLTIKPLASVEMEEEICDGETFDFFGRPLTESGTYYDTLDCVAYQLDLDVKPSAHFQLEETICRGDTYDFLGTPLHNEGLYFKTIDCQFYSLDLKVNPKPMLLCSSDTLIRYGGYAVLEASGADSYLWSTGDTTNRITVSPKESQTYSVTGFSKQECKSRAYIKVTIDALSDGEIIIYPNPANDIVEIDMPLIDEVEIFNLYGVRIEQIDAEREAVLLDVSHYCNGIYFVHVRCLKKHYYKKLVIQH